MTNAANLYDSLFNAKTSPLNSDLQADLDAITEQAATNVAAMTEEQKIAEFNRIMGR